MRVTDHVAVSTTGGVAQALAYLRQAHRFELDDSLPQGVSGNRVNVVEIDDAVGRQSVICHGEFEFGDQAANRPGDCRDDHRPDAICNWVSGEHEYLAVRTERPALDSTGGISLNLPPRALSRGR